MAVEDKSNSICLQFSIGPSLKARKVGIILLELERMAAAIDRRKQIFPVCLFDPMMIPFIQSSLITKADHHTRSGGSYFTCAFQLDGILNEILKETILRKTKKTDTNHRPVHFIFIDMTIADIERFWIEHSPSEGFVYFFRNIHWFSRRMLLIGFMSISGETTQK
jgi:hypothetical protein